MTIDEIKSAIAKETSFIDNKLKVIDELKILWGRCQIIISQCRHRNGSSHAAKRNLDPQKL